MIYGIPNWAGQQAALFDAFQIQQRMAEDNWAIWNEVWRCGSQSDIAGLAFAMDPRVAPGGSKGLNRNVWDVLSRLAGITARQVSLGPVEPKFARGAAQLSETGLACLAAMQRYNALHLRALLGINTQFFNSLSADDSPDPPASLRALFERWIESGDRVLLDLFRSDDYLAVQRELLEGLMRYRVQSQSLQDAFAKVSGQPTRAEIDDAHRSIYELRRELRKQRRLQRELRETVSAGLAERGSRTTSAAVKTTDAR